MLEVVVYVRSDRSPDNTPGFRINIEDAIDTFFGGKARLTRWLSKGGFVYYTLVVDFPESTPRESIISRSREAFSRAYFEVFGKVPPIGVDRITPIGLQDVFVAPEFQWVVLGIGSGMTVGILVLGLIKLIRG